MGDATVSAHGAEIAAQLAEVCVAIAGLDALERGAQLRLVGDRLRQNLELPAESHDLRLLRVRLCGQRCKRLLLRVGESRAGAHAEGVVENDQKQTAVGVGGSAPHKGIGKGQHDEQHQRKAQREQQQIPAADDGAWSSACRAQRT